MQLFQHDAFGGLSVNLTAADAPGFRSWALAIAAEWRYLFAASNVTSLDAGSFDATVLRSERAWLVMFSDGLVCSQCRTAKTNLMRLSASLRGLPVGLGIVVVVLADDERQLVAARLVGDLTCGVRVITG